MLNGYVFYGKPLCLQTIIGTEDVCFLLNERIADHREYLVKQLTTFHFRISKAFPALILYAVERTVILPLVADVHLLHGNDPALDQVTETASQWHTATATVELLAVDGLTRVVRRNDTSFDLASSQSLFACIYSRLFINHPIIRHKVTQ